MPAVLFDSRKVAALWSSLHLQLAYTLQMARIDLQDQL